MNKIWTYSLLLALLLPSLASADVHRGSQYFRNANIKVDANSVGNIPHALMVNRTRYKEINLSDFTLSADGVVLSAATVPGMVLANLMPALEWAQSETAKIQATFRVPEDYVSGQTFYCMFSLDAASADTTVDFNIYVNQDGLAYDAATTNQTPVAIANDTTKNNDVALTVATDTFTAGDLVTLELWRAAGTGAGSNLNLLGCYLSYTADM